MSLSPPSCPDRAGLARSNATRSGYPVDTGRKVLLYALSNVARSNATRSNYTSGRAFIAIGGVPILGGGTTPPGTPAILTDTLTIQDTLDELPNTATCIQHFGTPQIGQAVSITTGSQNNLQKTFTGTILSCRSFYVGTPQNPHFELNLIDDTPGLNTRKVWAQATNSTVATIATSLVTTYAPAYTLQIDPTLGAVVLDTISMAGRDLTDALTQLMKRAGGHWKCDYGKRVILGPDGGPNPRIINAVHPSLLSIDVTRDYSQVVTRVLSEGGGGNLLQQMTPGETIVPLDTGVWYEPSGTVTVGAQRLTYTSVDVGGGGSLVGPGAAPTAALVAQLASGAGVTSGSHDYAVGFVTATGESIQGPRTTITVGVLTPPVAPTIGTVLAGNGPDPGVHQYAVSFVSSSGETVPGATASATTGVFPAPTDAPIAAAPTTGGSVDLGFHDYAVTFVTAIGETTPGPISGGVSTTAGAPIPAPGSAATASAPTTGGGIDPGQHDYNVTYVTTFGETTTGPTSNRVTTTAPTPIAPTTDFAVTVTFGGNLSGSYCWGATFVLPGGETIVGQHGASISVGGTFSANASNVPLGPAGTTARKIYRTVSGGLFGQWKFLLQINDNATTTFTDNIPDASLGGPAPSSGPMTPGTQTVPLSTIPIGPAGTTGRRIYRTSGGQPARLLTQLSNNTATTYTDTSANSSLGAGPPGSSPSGTGAQTVPVSNILPGPSGTTARKLYRRSGGAGLRLLTTLNNNSTTTYTDSTANSSLGAAPPAASTATLEQVPLTIATGGPLVTARKVWGTAAGAAQLKLVTTIADNTTTAYTVTIADASLGANAPVVNTATGNQVALSSIPIGAATVTQRKIYRTAAGTTPLKLAITLADNTTTTALDTLPDASLGANAPASDTSGLQQPPGAVLAGSTAIIVAGVGGFPATGWAVIGNGEQVIRYTGLTGTSLTGIPAAGLGSIQASIAYNSTITAPAQLRGVPVSGTGAIRFMIPDGEPVNLLVTENNLPAQTALAALLGTDGVQEDLISDNRLSSAEARSRARAWLALRKDPEVSVRAETRDRNTVTGRTLTVNLGVFGLASVPFLIQSVTEHTFTPALGPHFSLQASTVRFTFDDWQRMIKEGIG